MRTTLFLSLLIISVMSQAQTMFIGHRGASYLAPENTLASVKLGYELGADAVEIDVHLSADKKVMVNHDKSTGRTGSGENLVIKNTNSDDLRKLEVGSFKDEKYRGEKIPFLSEVIELIPPGKKLVVEIKCDAEVLPYMKEVIEESGKASQIIFIGFGWETILEAKTTFPENDCYWLSGIKIGIKSKIEKAKEAGLSGVNLNYKIIDKDLVDFTESLGMSVLAWTVDDPVDAKALIGMGVKALTTNRPKWLKEQVEM